MTGFKTFLSWELVLSFLVFCRIWNGEVFKFQQFIEFDLIFSSKFWIIIFFFLRFNSLGWICRKENFWNSLFNFRLLVLWVLEILFENLMYYLNFVFPSPISATCSSIQPKHIAIDVLVFASSFIWHFLTNLMEKIQKYFYNNSIKFINFTTCCGNQGHAAKPMKPPPAGVWKDL